MSPNHPTSRSPDFDLLFGGWQVDHRRLKQRLAQCQDWVEFDGDLSARPILGGLGNIDENILRSPDGTFRAVSLRSFNPEDQRWSLWWLDGLFPGRIDAPVVGVFKHGVGTIYAEETLHDKTIRVRFLWTRAGTSEPQWEQAFSEDFGQTRETHWIMRFTSKTQQ